MEKSGAALAARIRGGIPEGMTQGSFARDVGMAPDAFSRALNGQRGFSVLELTRIAERTDIDLAWLITGRADPHQMAMAARHDWDARARTRSNPGRERDESVLEQIHNAYRAAFPRGATATPALPVAPTGVQAALGGDFVRTFAERLDAGLGVDVVRVQGVRTDYALRIGERSVIVLGSTANWFRSNWSLAHELGHLALGHLDPRGTDSAEATTTNENSADAFASELLLPSSMMRAVDWRVMPPQMVAKLLWDWGVSTAALRNRLAYLRVEVPEEIQDVLRQTTPAVLRQHGALFGGSLAVAERQQESLARHFPVSLVSALTDRVTAGEADPRVLAWVLEADVDDLDFPEPDESDASLEYEALLEGRM